MGGGTRWHGYGAMSSLPTYQRKSSEVEEIYYGFFFSNLFTRMVSSVKFSTQEKSMDVEEEIHVLLSL